jgi:predicted heme/steroid binding protein
MKSFTSAELARCDGKEGRPAYIAYEGKIYDVSGSFLWKGGRHQALHEAGRDLTGILEQAPHGADLLERVHSIGVLSDEPPRVARHPRG